MSFLEKIQNYVTSREALLNNLHNKICAKHNLYLQYGAELEFYALEDNASFNLPSNITLTEEKGHRQFELQFQTYDNPVELCRYITELRDSLSQQGCIFAAKPFPTDYGSAIHFHLSFHNAKGSNLFEEISANIIGALCAGMKEAMIFFAPYQSSYGRFNSRIHDNPTTVSWGGNNRTTSLRIPTSEADNRRIEHRVAGSDSDPFLALSAILIGAIYGLEHHIKPPQRIYGIASHPQYALEPLLDSYEAAIEAFENGTIIRTFMDEIG
jgi:glutamine synthetase